MVISSGSDDIEGTLLCVSPTLAAFWKVLEVVEADIPFGFNVYLALLKIKVPDAGQGMAANFTHEGHQERL